MDAFYLIIGAFGVEVLDKDLAIVVDGSYFLHRAWNIVHPMAHNYSQCDTPTNAIHGFLRTFTSLTRRFEPKYVSVVFDSPEPTFRHKLHDGYKAHRPEHPEDLIKQLEFLKRIIPAMGYTLSIHPGLEGDDIIGTVAKKFEEAGCKVIIATGDKDIAQLVNENIRIEKNSSTELMTVDGVIKKFGIKPEQIPDYLALMGDKSDGIDGIPGFGPKTAVKWLEKWGSIKGILEGYEGPSIEMTIGEMMIIEENRLRFEFNLKLTTIVVDEDIGFELEAFTVMPRNQKDLRVVAKELNMSYQMDQY